MRMPPGHRKHGLRVMRASLTHLSANGKAV